MSRSEQCRKGKQDCADALTTSHHHSRRAFIGASVAGLVAATVAQPARAAGAKLHVLLAIDLAPRILQKALQGALSGVEVFVYGRVGDFARGLRDAPDAAIAIRESLEAFGLRPRLQGSVNGQVTEEYVLAALGAPPDPRSVASVGVVDLFGRERLTQFTARLLGASPSVKSVTKVADLLPLLQLGNAASAILSRSAYEALRGRTSQSLASTSLPNRLGRVAVAGSASDVIARVKALPADINNKLGIDAWT